jgi:hypothetical protein
MRSKGEEACSVSVSESVVQCKDVLRALRLIDLLFSFVPTKEGGSMFNV